MGARNLPAPPLTPQARLERGMRLIAEGMREALTAVVAESGASSEWVDQNHSPLGKRRHLALAREQKIASKKHGHLVLILREDLNQYIEREGLSRGKRTADEDVKDVLERIESRSKR